MTARGGDTCKTGVGMENDLCEFSALLGALSN